MYNDCVTIFCQCQTNIGVAWYKYVIEAVDVNTDHAWLARNYGTDASERMSLHIRYTIQEGKTKVGDYEYLPPREWDTIPHDQKSKYITFDGGKTYSIIVAGRHDEYGEVINDDDFRQGFLQALKSECDGVYSVTRTAQMSLIPHFEITGG